MQFRSSMRLHVALVLFSGTFTFAPAAYVGRSLQKDRRGTDAVFRKALVVGAWANATDVKTNGRHESISTEGESVDSDGHGHGHGGHSSSHGSGHSSSHGAHGHDHHGHHGHDGHGHGKGAASYDSSHGHGHHEPYDPVAGTIAIMLFGTVAWVVSLFYFVNWPDEDIQQATWKTLSDMISIFCAVLIFSATTRSLQDFVGSDFGHHHHGPPPTKSLIVSQCRFWILFVLLQVTFCVLKDKPWWFSYTAGVGCHIVGFGAIDAFGTMLHLQVFASSVFMSVAGVVVFAIFLLSIFSLTAKLRQKHIKGTRMWRRCCVEFEGDASALAFGLLFSMLIRYGVSGHLPPVHGAPRGKTTYQVCALFFAAAIQGPMVILLSIGKHRVEAQKKHLDVVLRELLSTAHATMKMSMGWTLLFWGYWCFYNRVGDHDGVGGKIGQRVTMALVFSGLVFSSIIIIDKVADRFKNQKDGHAIEGGLRDLLATFALLMGLAWEACFVQAVHAVSLKYHGSTQMWMVVAVTAALCVVVLPAWALYILPKSMEESPEEFEEEFKNTPRRAMETPSVTYEEPSATVETPAAEEDGTS